MGLTAGRMLRSGCEMHYHSSLPSILAWIISGLTLILTGDDEQGTRDRKPEGFFRLRLIRYQNLLPYVMNFELMEDVDYTWMKQAAKNHEIYIQILAKILETNKFM